jgi:putative transposase
LYQVKRVNIGKTTQLDELARECGKLYSQTLVFFWRTVRHKDIWLKPKHLMQLLHLEEAACSHCRCLCPSVLCQSCELARTQKGR